MAIPRNENLPPWQPVEVSCESSESVALAYANYASENDPRTRDPFDILAELEEELGHPLALQ